VDRGWGPRFGGRRTGRPAAAAARLCPRAVAVGVAAPCAPPSLQARRRHYQRNDGVGPPPSEAGIGDQTDQDGGRQIRACHRQSPVSGNTSALHGCAAAHRHGGGTGLGGRTTAPTTMSRPVGHRVDGGLDHLPRGAFGVDRKLGAEVDTGERRLLDPATPRAVPAGLPETPRDSAAGAGSNHLRTGVFPCGGPFGMG
jgi:hypothetical protein